MLVLSVITTCATRNAQVFPDTPSALCVYSVQSVTQLSVGGVLSVRDSTVQASAVHDDLQPWIELLYVAYS